MQCSLLACHAGLVLLTPHAPLVLPSCTPCCPLTHPSGTAPRLAPQLLRAVLAGQQVLGDLYDAILKEVRARGQPAESETRLWACLARLKDPKTGRTHWHCQQWAA
jgi:hypothetical protein